MRLLRLILIQTGIVLWTTAAALAALPDCETIADQVGARAGLPKGLLPAISRVETGRKQGDHGVRGWPWTLNVQGKGYYFDTKAQALAKLRQVLKDGVTNVDVGCMQINYRWHHQHFSSVEAMMDPQINTRYAAEFLLRLAKRHGAWDVATKYYHSSDSKRGKAYLGRVNRVLAKLPGEPSFVASTADNPHTSGSGGAGGSNPYHAALVARRSGVMAIADRPLVGDVTVQTGGSYVNLPNSPLPNLSLAKASSPEQTQGRRRRQASSTNRQSLLAQLRAEFAQP